MQKDGCASGVIPHITPSISNPEKKGNIHDLVTEIFKDILNTGRNVPEKKQPMSEQ